MAVLTNKVRAVNTTRAKLSTRDRNISIAVESFRKRIKSIYPDAIFETEFVLGTTIPEWVLYLESLMQSGMTWENKKEKWCIRSIKPMHQFDVMAAEGFYAYFHYTNMKPEWKKVKGFVADPNNFSPIDRNADQVEST